MIDRIRAGRGGLARHAVLVIVVLLACGCGASARASAPSAASATQNTCQQVSAVLSDGPDPDADPVGYAQAQVLPLRQLTISDATLRTAVLTLAAAYQKYSTSSGSIRAAAAAVVTKAENEVNKICPQAAQ